MRNCRLWVVGIGLLLSGCSENFALVAYSPGFRSPDEQVWKFEKTPQPPRNSLEELAVKVATNRQTIKTTNLMAGYLGEDGEVRMVVVFEEISRTRDRFAQKKVDRFLVKAGGIHAYLGPSIEPFPDFEFEKAVLIAARNARSEAGFSVLLFEDWYQPVVLKAVLMGECTVEVTAKNGFNPQGDVLCVKQVNLCKPDSD